MPFSWIATLSETPTRAHCSPSYDQSSREHVTSQVRQRLKAWQRTYSANATYPILVGMKVHTAQPAPHTPIVRSLLPASRHYTPVQEGTRHRVYSYSICLDQYTIFAASTRIIHPGGYKIRRVCRRNLFYSAVELVDGSQQVLDVETIAYSFALLLSYYCNPTSCTA